MSRRSGRRLLLSSILSILLALSAAPSVLADDPSPEATPSVIVEDSASDPNGTQGPTDKPDSDNPGLGTPSSPPGADTTTPDTEGASSAPSADDPPLESLPPQSDSEDTFTETTDENAPVANPTNGIPALSIVLDDGATLAKVHEDKDVRWNSSIALADPNDASNNLTASGVQFKGRGNSTWTIFQKKPYQIKFSSKTSVLGMPKAKAWVLLANHADATFLRNNTAFTAANGLNLAGTPHESRFVDLTVNGEYLGLYQLTEKIEVGKDRLDLKDPTGVMVEMDNTYGHYETIKFNSTTSGTTFVLKDQVGDVSDDDVMDGNVAEGWNNIRTSINTFDKLIYAPNPDWNAISQVIDIESFARFFLLEEFASDSDVSVSSVYFYQDGPNDKLHVGPAWDFDIALGNCDSLFRGVLTDDNYVVNSKWYRDRGTDWYTQLFRMPEFVRLVNGVYDDLGRNAFAAATSSIPEQSQLLSQASSTNFTKWPTVLGRNSVIPQCERIVLPTAAQENQRLVNWTSERAAYMDTVYGDSTRPVLSVQVNTQSTSWHPAATGGMMQGTMGKSKRLEALRLDLLPGANGETVSGDVSVNAHVSGVGWQGWTSELAGTTGQAKAIEALQIKLTGDVALTYDIRYRVFVQSYGWLPWVSNGQNAGTVGQSKRVEAVQIQLVDKGSVNTSANFTETPNFYLNDSWGPTANIAFAWGSASDKPLVGDWDGDGKDTLAVRRGASYSFTNDTIPAASPRFPTIYGRSTDQVFVGDWDGDGKDTLAVRRGNTYYFKNSISGGNADKVVTYGKTTDQVLVGDWDVDGKDTLAVRRGSTYYFKNSISGGNADKVVTYGKTTDDVYTGKFSEQFARDSLTVRRGNQYFISYTIRGGDADSALVYGRPNDTTLVGDWNGDGVDTLGVKR